MNVTVSQLTTQINAVKKNGLFAALQTAALNSGYRVDEEDIIDLSLAYVLAVASRETNIKNILGDGGHGVGVIQIDTRYHDIARRMKDDDNWRTQPEVLIRYGVKMLQDNVQWAAKRWPTLTYRQHLKIAASAYNSGRGGAQRGVAVSDCDAFTTGKDYGEDVLERMDAITKLLTV